MLPSVSSVVPSNVCARVLTVFLRKDTGSSAQHEYNPNAFLYPSILRLQESLVLYRKVLQHADVATLISDLK